MRVRDGCGCSVRAERLQRAYYSTDEGFDLLGERGRFMVVCDRSIIGGICFERRI